MLSALKINYHGHGSSSRSLSRRPPLHPSQPRSVRSTLLSTLCGAKNCRGGKVLDPSQLADMTQAPQPKMGRPNCKTSVSSGNDHPWYPDPPVETTADSASSLDSTSSSTGKDKKGQRHSPFRRLIKLVSPIKGLPGLLSHRKVSNKESSVDKPTKEGTQVCELNIDVEDDISVLELPVEVNSSSWSHGKEPSSPALPAAPAPAAGPGSSTTSSGSGSESSQASDTAKAGVASINSIECKVELDLPGMVSTTPTGVSGSKSKVHHTPKVLAPLRGPLPPSVSSGADAKPSSIQPAKRKTPLYRMKMLLDLKKVTESNEEPEKLPHIPTLKEWIRQEKKKERAEKKAAKKAMKKEKQLKKELEQEQKVTGIKAQARGPARSEAANSGSLQPMARKEGELTEVKKEQTVAGIDKIDTKQPKLAWCKGNTESEKAPHVQCSAPRPLSRKQSGAAQIPPRVAGVLMREQSAQEKAPPQSKVSNKQPEHCQKELNVRGPDAKQPKMAWCDVPSVKEECSGPKMPILKKSRDEPKVSGVMKNKKEPLQRPLGAHHRRRRSTLVNVQEQSPEQYYSRPAAADFDSDGSVNGDEDEHEQRMKYHAQVRRPLAAHYKRRRNFSTTN